MGTALLVLALTILLWVLLWRSARDLSKFEIASAHSESRFQTLLSLMPAAVYTCDLEGKITFFNKRAAEIWGREPKLGDTDQKFCGSFRLWLPNGLPLPHDKTPVALALKEGLKTRNGDVIIEREDGSKVFVSVNIDPLCDSAGNRYGVINVFQDVTQIKRTEQDLRAREQHLQAIIDTTPECVKLVDAEGTLLAMNRAGLGMIEADDAGHVIGKTVNSLITPEFQEAFRQMNDRVCAGAREHLEFELLTLKGNRRWMETDATSIVEPKSGKKVQLAVTRDMTDRRKAELDLQRKTKQLATFLETAALGLHRVGPDGIV